MYFYTQLRHVASGEVTSVYAYEGENEDDEPMCLLPGILVYPADEHGRGLVNNFKSERISKSEFETLLAFHGIDVQEFLQREDVDFWLFGDRVKMYPTDCKDGITRLLDKKEMILYL